MRDKYKEHKRNIKTAKLCMLARHKENLGPEGTPCIVK
jgi:hypothetical protein